MSCQEYRVDLIEAARSGDDTRIREHVRGCGICAGFFEEQKSLNDAMRTLDEPVSCDGLEPLLLLEFDSRWPANKNPVKRSPVKWLWLAVPLAAAITLAVWLQPKSVAPVLTAVTPVKAKQPVAVDIQQPVPVTRPIRRQRHSQDQGPFIPIPYTTPLEPYERAQVMHLEMPVAQLIAAGLPIATSDPGAEARADVLVGNDGRARAIRVVSIFERSIDQ